jgi:CHAT domain-containing protein
MFFLFMADTDPQNPLLDAAKEAEFLIDSLTNEIQHKLINQYEANLFEIQQQMLRGCDIIHYAGHAEFDDRMRRGFIPLPKSEKMFPDDIPNLSGNPFVFLNGCATDKQVGAQWTDSLVNAFISHGAKGVIGTLFKIESVCAKDFALCFYKRLLRGEAIGEALRLARLEIREQFPNDMTPLAFILYGNPTMRIAKPIPPLPWKKDGSLDDSKFSAEALEFLRSALQEMQRSGSGLVEPSHVLSAFQQTAIGKRLMTSVRRTTTTRTN